MSQAYTSRYAVRVRRSSFGGRWGERVERVEMGGERGGRRRNAAIVGWLCCCSSTQFISCFNSWRPRERVRTRREPGGSYRILIHTSKIKSHFVFVWVGNGQISMFLLEQVCSGLVQGQLLVGYRGVPQLNIVGYRGLVQGYRGCPSWIGEPKGNQGLRVVWKSAFTRPTFVIQTAFSQPHHPPLVCILYSQTHQFKFIIFNSTPLQILHNSKNGIRTSKGPGCVTSCMPVNICNGSISNS